MASMAVSVVPKAVIRMTRALGSRSLICFKTSRPLWPGILISMITRSGFSCAKTLQASVPFFARETRKPCPSSMRFKE